MIEDQLIIGEKLLQHGEKQRIEDNTCENDS